MLTAMRSPYNSGNDITGLKEEELDRNLDMLKENPFK